MTPECGTATFAFTYHGDGVFAVHVRWVVVWEQRGGQAAGRVGVRSVATNLKAMERTLKRFEVTRLLVLPDGIAVVVASEVGSLVVVGAVVVPEMQERAIVTTILVLLSGILHETDFEKAV